MFCDNCGARIDARTPLCPHCGYLVKSGPGRPAVIEDGTLDQGRRLPGCSWFLMVILMTGILVMGIIGLGALGVYRGLQDRGRLNERQAEAYYASAVKHLDQGNYEFALAELEEVLRLNPNHQGARDKLTEVRVALTGGPTPTSQAQQQAADSIFEEARGRYNQGDWTGAISRLEELRTLYPDYQARQVEEMLFSACYNTGIQLVNQDRLEEAIAQFDRSLALRPENPNALGQRRMASLYLAGLSYWDQDWAQVVENLRLLFAIKADYKDVRQRLRQAYINLGDAYYADDAWCVAERYYAQALAVSPNAIALSKRDDAAQRCLTALAPPTPTFTATPLPTATSPPTATPLPPTPTLPPQERRFVARIVEVLDIPPDRMHIRGQVLDREGNIMPGVEVKIYAWDWSALATTGTDGWYSFDGLANPVTYTLTLTQFPVDPIDVAGEWGKQPMVYFREQ